MSTSVSSLFNQRNLTSSTVNSGVTAGDIFGGRGDDFLHPRDILGSVNDFSGTISPGSGNSPFLLIGSNPIPKNATPTTVITGTTNLIDTILSPGFANNILAPSPSLNQDLADFNPLVWQNPNSLNVLLGTMDATNKIFGGSGLLQPNLVPPLYPFVAPSLPPFQELAPSLASQAQLFPNTFFSGSSFFQPLNNTPSFTQAGLLLLQLQAQIGVLQQDIADLQERRANVLKSDRTGAEDNARVEALAAQLQAQITQKTTQLNQAQQRQVQLQAQLSQVRTSQVVAASPVGFLPVSSVSLARGALVLPVQSQPNLLNWLLPSEPPSMRQGGILSGTINGVTVNQLAEANGVPAWIA